MNCGFLKSRKNKFADWDRNQCVTAVCTSLLIPRYEKCRNSGGEYVEKEINKWSICSNKSFHETVFSLCKRPQGNLPSELENVELIPNVQYQSLIVLMREATDITTEDAAETDCVKRYCNEIETLAHVLGSCQHGELLRNSRHHNIRKLIAEALRNRSFEVHEEVHCVASEGGGIRRADIVALDKTNSKGFILDPTVRFEMSQTQPSEVNKEKQQIYDPTIPYFREKHQMEGTWEVHGLMIGARGTIPRSTVNTTKTFGIHDIIQK
ncbi:hypothetical protein ANN_01953 [Periplaneta americana]|uniref:Uncharacterized protein n=1 Tax=Periplaneta americana TaxID=6978 RepID=A0ABQ8TXC6_PERAM|nr:hypothetical protein ANN_01953 [Periplaneta americana]